MAESGEHEAERYRELAALRALIERTLSDALSSGIWSSLRARDQLGPLQNNARRLEEALRASKAVREARAGRHRAPGQRVQLASR